VTSFRLVYQVIDKSYLLHIDHFLKIDTQLNIEVTAGEIEVKIGEILEVLYSRSPEKHG